MVWWGRGVLREGEGSNRRVGWGVPETEKLMAGGGGGVLVVARLSLRRHRDEVPFVLGGFFACRSKIGRPLGTGDRFKESISVSATSSRAGWWRVDLPEYSSETVDRLTPGWLKRPLISKAGLLYVLYYIKFQKMIPLIVSCSSRRRHDGPC